MPALDRTLPLALKGYAWLPDLRRAARDRPVRMRVLGQPAVGICGPEATRFFYDEDHLERHGALPGPVVDTLFGRGAVHTLDGAAHRVRKAIFVTLLTGDGVDDLAELAGEGFDAAYDRWHGGPAVSLLEEAAKVIAGAVSRWAGLPAPAGGVDGLAADLVAMVDGFATLGPRHWRARAARRRQEHRLAAL